MRNIRNLINSAFLYILMLPLLGCLQGEFTAAESVLNGSPLPSFAGAVSAENINGTVIRIHWALSMGSVASEYKIYAVNSDNSLTLLGSALSSESFFDHTGLESGQLYRYVVRMVSSSETQDSNQNIVKGLAYAGISGATVVSATAVDLEFPATSSATNLKIYCTTAAANMSLFASVSPTSVRHSLTGLSSGLSYRCQVKAVFDQGREDSNTLTTTFTPQDIVSSSPFGFSGINTAANIGDSSAQIDWLPANPAIGTTISGYRIFQISSDGLTDDVFDVPAATSNYTAINLLAGENYGFIVRAFDSNLNTDGNQFTKSIFTYAGITSAVANDSQSATVNFPAAPMATSLKIYCYLAGGTVPSTATAEISSSLGSYQLTNLTSGSSYTCKVKALGLGGLDSNSAAITFSTP